MPYEKSIGNTVYQHLRGRITRRERRKRRGFMPIYDSATNEMIGKQDIWIDDEDYVRWEVYDATTGQTLFTSDSFGWVKALDECAQRVESFRQVFSADMLKADPPDYLL